MDMNRLIDMLPDITHKQKMFLNMLIAQMGFASFTIVILLVESPLYYAIGINLFFATLIAYLNWAAYKRITSGIKIFHEKMDNLVDFVFMKTNRLKRVEYHHNDEISLVLKALDSYEKKFDEYRKEDTKVLGEILLVLDKMSQGIYNCRVVADSRNFIVKALRDTTNKTLDINEATITELKNTLHLYTDDDFTKKAHINDRLKDDMRDVMESVNLLGDALNKGARQNLSNGQHLEKNANTMSASVTNLANKANQQAASLEETAAALEEITSITRGNADNAVKMSELGSRVKKAVSDGLEQADKTSSSMDEINNQVSAINEAIAVIDQIAFQTNILSLNAAVEAATAGEAGKGFAVVAGEVRNLASRSAEAANEIKAIVESAAQKANSGKKISDDMIKGYKVLNEHFNETIGLIDDVSSASKEQMTGIEQINDAVTMLDKVTQENAHEANSVAVIANDVSDLANGLVLDARSKRF
jgi:methyl-accepting chemotaxis protein